VYTRCEMISSSSSITTFAALDSASKIKWDRLYRGSEHGFTAATFHRICDNKGPTVVLIRAENGRVAAGYSCVSWTSVNSAEENPRGFLCANDTNENSLCLFKGVPRDCRVQQYIDQGPGFSGGVYISDACNKNYNSSSNIGTGFDSHGDPLALFGKERIKVVEYEVFGIALSY
jgi:hypothetical protein